MALGANFGNKSFSPVRSQFASQRTKFFWVKKKRGPGEQSLAPGEDPINDYCTSQSSGRVYFLWNRCSVMYQDLKGGFLRRFCIAFQREPRTVFPSLSLSICIPALTRGKSVIFSG